MNYTALLDSYVQSITKMSREKYPTKLSEMAAKRNFSENLLRDLGVFYVGEQIDMMSPEHIDHMKDFGVISDEDGRVMFRDRYLFPIRDIDHRILNLCGYAFGHDVKYLYGTAKYYNRKDDMYGLEEWGFAVKMGWAVIVEGITDCVALRDIGIINSFARCGTAKSEHVNNMLSRLKYGVVFISDRDKAGDNTVKHWKASRCVRVNICDGSKDIDEYLNGTHNGQPHGERVALVKECINSCAGWLMEGMCAGMNDGIVVEGNYSLM